MEDCLAATDFFAGLSWPDRLAIDFNEKSVQGNKTQAARRCKEDSLLWLLMPYHNYKMDRGKALSVRGGSSQAGDIYQVQVIREGGDLDG